jgi:RHS repeat-associated protein
MQTSSSTTTFHVCAFAYLFTGKERDSESGLDYFGARMYGSSMGRFMSPDPSGLGYADPTNPQSLNLYSYGLNNPLTNVDPTGLSCVLSDNGTPGDDGDGLGCAAAGILPNAQPNDADGNANPNQFDQNKTVDVNVDAPQQGQDLAYDARVAYDQPVLARMQPVSLSPDQYRTAIIQQVAQKTAGFPDVCSGGAFIYAGVQSPLSSGHGFGGYLGNYDSKAGGSNNFPAEGSGESAGVAGAVGSKGAEALAFIPFAEAGGALMGVSKEGLAFGGYAGTPERFPLAVGACAYLNISTLGGCRHH